MERKSDFFFDLSSQAKERYEAKVVSAGLRIDLYAIEDWKEVPKEVPDVRWSDTMLYMVSTPSPYTSKRDKGSEKKNTSVEGFRAFAV